MTTDPHRLLKHELGLRDIDRRALLIAAELVWDDLLDCVTGDRIDEAELIGLLPRAFQARAAEDWSRWLATFSTVLWKLA